MKAKTLVGLYLLAGLLVLPGLVLAQKPDMDPIPQQPVLKSLNLSGPRVGVTYLTGEGADVLKNDHGVNTPVIVQFGYQFEKRFFSSSGGVTALTEIIPLVGGLDQQLFIPSLSWLIGVRTADGFEVGFGPNVTVIDNALEWKSVKPSFVFAGGITLRAGDLNFPVNLAVSRSKESTRFSLMTGFNIK